MSISPPAKIIEHLSSQYHRLPATYRSPLVLTSALALLLTPYFYRRLTHHPILLPAPPLSYPFTLSSSCSATSQTLTLPSGRHIGFSTFGAPDGKPIITLHGIIGSRLEAALFHVNALQLGIRIIALDRPGIGLSSPYDKPVAARSLLDHAADVGAVAEYLGLDSYAVLGTSGGGPYALACAYALPPEKPKAVGVVTGLGLPGMNQMWPAPLVWLNARVDLSWIMQFIFFRSGVWDLRKSDAERFEVMRGEVDLGKMHAADLGTAGREEYYDWMMLSLKSGRESVRQGWKGFRDDSKVLTREPGFKLEEIRNDLPVRLWYGTDDTNVSSKAGDEIAQRLRNGGNEKVELHMFDGETHGSTQVKYQKRYLEDLLRAMSE